MSDNNTAAKAARLAVAAANIAKGAVSGGLHGAAVAAAKSFAPEIIKAAVVILCVLLILPLLVFAAIPNILFGYGNSKSADIIALTQKAYSVDAAYKEVKNYNQEAVNRIIENAKAVHTSEDDEPEYDEVEVTEDIDNTNIYWLIAIASVAHQQDLYTMDETSIKSMTVSKIVSTASVSETTDVDGENAKVMKKLKIDINDLNPQKLMEKLGFSDEEKNWARLLYATLAEEQYVDISDSDGEGYYGTDYGDITFTDAETEVVYYNQTDSRWGGLSYGKTGTIASSGCGPTSLAIVVATLTSNKVTPKEVSKWAYDNGYRAEGQGSYHSLMTDGGRHYGLKVEGIGRDSKKLVTALQEGKLAIAIMSKGHFTSGGHFIVLRGVTENGKILVADPASVTRSNQLWNLGIITNEVNRGAGSGGPF